MKSYREWKKLNELLGGMGGENPPVSTYVAKPESASPNAMTAIREKYRKKGDDGKGHFQHKKARFF